MLNDKIGQILVKQGVITRQQLDDALAEVEKSNESLDLLLAKMGLVTPTQLCQAYAEQFGFPFIQTITEQMVDPKQLSKIPLRFLRSHVIMPVMHEGKRVIVTSDPRDVQPLDDLALLLASDTGYAIALRQSILDAINKFYPFEADKEMMDELSEEAPAEGFDLGNIEEKDIMEMANDAPIVKLVNHIIFQAVKEGASDIHIEPFEKDLSIRYRVDGEMYQSLMPPKRYQGAIVSRLKIMADLNIAEKRLPQDGRIQLKVADKTYDFRVSILPCKFGERIVMRILDKSKGTAELESLNFSERDFQTITRVIERPNGIILVSGPTGSGKTTTLYSILMRLNKIDVNIITVEDPVEYTISGISQVQVQAQVGLTFAAALRSILRQDPDIVLIGEIRDGETAQIATQAALTGHLVLSTVHTNSAPATITRLIDMGIEPFLVSSSLACVISQRLVRTLCDDCKQVYEPTDEMLKRLGETRESFGTAKVYKAVGCDKCSKKGYRGRNGVFEVMEVTDSLIPHIIARADSSVIKREAIKQGMTLMIQDGVRLIKQGKTTVEEVLGVAFAQVEI